MQADNIISHHPVAFWSGCVAVAAGVLLHLPMFLMAAPMHFHMAGMSMDWEMLLGMALIPVGVALAAYGLLPRVPQLRKTLHANAELPWQVADDVPLGREHWKLVAVLAIALTIDVMKPASIAFVMPGMADEYGMGMDVVGYLALLALVGTALGSVLWGRLADIAGRRAAILLSAILFMGTSICGAMPSFAWNMVMCFLMGVAAGGMLPVTFALMAETVPARHRGWLLVGLGGVGTTAGFLAASVAATLLVPHFSWRALWLLNMPTGLMIIVLNRFIPESPRFLVNAGLPERARAVLARFVGDRVDATAAADKDGATARASIHAGIRSLGRGRHARITLALLVCGLAWGLANFGFVLWLPANLQKMSLDAHTVSELMAQSALLAIPGIIVVVWLYQRWSSFKTLVLFVVLMMLALSVFAAIGIGEWHAQAMTVAATVLLLIGISGVIATMVPYAAEIYPVHLRSTGAGLIAAGSKAGGVLGAVAGVVGLFDSFLLAALVIVIPMALAGVLLWYYGIETRGHELEAIQQQLLKTP